MALDSGTRAGKNGRHEEAERKTRKKILSSWSFHGGRVNSGISLPRVRNRNEKKKSREREREREKGGEGGNERKGRLVSKKTRKEERWRQQRS